MKTADLIGPHLDWAVAQAAGKGGDIEVHAGNVLYGRATSGFIHYRPSTNWGQGGPLIDEYGIDCVTCVDGYRAHASHMVPRVDNGHRSWHTAFGHTRLVASMRTLVRLKLGDEVDIPDTILNR